MSDWTTNTASTATTASVTYESLVATIAKLKPMPRDVFVYPGSIGEFQADLAASGVEMRGPAVTDPGAAPAPFGLHPIGSLGYWEVDGEVWIAGSYRDFRDARDGKIPVTRLTTRNVVDAYLSSADVSETGAD
jgi:hypothetical protein